MDGGQVVPLDRGRKRSESIDLTETYLLTGGTRVVQRGLEAVQIGTEPPDWMVLQDAPAESLRVLRGLDGTRPVGAVLREQRADPVRWSEVLGQLIDNGLLMRSADAAFPEVDADVLLRPERDSLLRSHGAQTAHRLWQSRSESLVVVRGSGRLATAIAGLLAASGIGHVHHRPDGPGGAGSENAGQLASVAAARLRRRSATVRTHPPAAHHHPDLVVLAGQIAPDPGDLAALLTSHLPHLAVRSGLRSAVIGPLVLPGRSTCLLCMDRHRRSTDPQWPTAAELRDAEPVVPPAILVSAAAAIAATEVLTLLDGQQLPGTVDGTVEWWTGQLAPRRRSWSRHPECGCRRPAPVPPEGVPIRRGPES